MLLEAEASGRFFKAQENKAGLDERRQGYEVRALKEQHPEYLSEVTEKNLEAVIEQAYWASADTVMVTDIDETINNCARRHFEIYHRYFKRLKKRREGEEVRDLPLPTYEQMLMLGGSHQAYGQFGERYWRLNAQVLANPNFNDNLPLVDEHLGRYFREIHRRWPFVGALSTRPESVQEITEKNLQRDLQLDEWGINLPVITRPETASLEITSAWKLALLETIAAGGRKRVIMLDDQRELINLIEQTANPRVRGVLMKGPRTPLPVPGEQLAPVYWQQLEERLSQFERRRRRG